MSRWQVRIYAPAEFDKYAKPILEFKAENCSEPVPIDDFKADPLTKEGESAYIAFHRVLK